MSIRILVVDDIPINTKILKSFLEREYYHVHTAKNGLEASELLKKAKYDLILIDTIMPEIEGMETIKRIKSSPTYAHIPIISITALKSCANYSESFSAGADEVLVKPVDKSLLLVHIKALVKLKPIPEALRVSENNGVGLKEILYEPINPITLDDARILVLDSNKEKCRAYKSLLNTYGFEVDIDSHKVADVRGDFFAECPDSPKRFNSDGFFKEEPALVCNDYSLIILTHSNTSEMLRICSMLQSKSYIKDVPILGIFDHINPDVLEQAFDLGMQDYIISSAHKENLIVKCKRQIQKYRHLISVKDSYEKQLVNASKDSLTNLYNRTYFESYVSRLASIHDTTLLIMLLDIDRFKKINDRFGHLVGDDVLKEFAIRIVSSLRKGDLCARWGGDEIAITCSGITMETGQMVATRIVSSISNKPFIIQREDGSHKKIPLSCCIGGSTLRKGESLTSLFSRIDLNLYQAKESERKKIFLD